MLSTAINGIFLLKDTSHNFEIEPIDNHRQANLCGPMDENLKTIERRIGVKISYRGHQFKVIGKPNNCQAAVNIIKDLYIETASVKNEYKTITPEMLHLALLDAPVLEQDPEQNVLQQPNKSDADNLDECFDKILTI